MFWEGRENTKHEDCSWCLLMSYSDQNVKILRDMLNSYQHLSFRMLADERNIPRSTVHCIVTENLSMQKICTKLVLKKQPHCHRVLSETQCGNTAEESSYRPELALIGPKIKMKIKGHYFGTLEAIREVTTRCLKGVPIDTFST